MNYSDLNFSIGELGFEVIFKDGVDGRDLLFTYGPFYVEQPLQKQIFRMEVGDGLVSKEAEGEFLGDFNVNDNKHTLYRMPGGGYKMLIDQLEDELACAFIANANFTEARVSLFGSNFDQSFGLNNAMMIMFAFSAAYHDTILIHSSTTMNNGKAYMFLGKSGTGKSTHSDLWVKHIEGSEILNDDNPVVGIRNGKVYVYGSPWSGKRSYYKQLRLPVSGFVQLEQAPENKIRRENDLQAFTYLLSSTSLMIWDKPSYNAICQTISKIAMQVPLFHLKNRPEEAAARMSYEALNQTI